MKIEDILQALPTKQDLATAVGLETRSSVAGDLVSVLGIFGTGMILGAGLALLLAPKTGQETRRDIAAKAGELGEQLRSAVPQAAPSGDAPNL